MANDSKTAAKSSSGRLNVFTKLPAGISFDVTVGEVPVKVVLNGYNGNDVLTTDDGAFGITRDVDATIFDQVLKEHGDAVVFKNGFIFSRDAAEDGKSAKDEAKDKGKAKTGFEPLDPSKHATE